MKPHHGLGLGMIEFFVYATFNEVTSSGQEYLQKHPRTLYISNHADIVREAGLINRELARAGLPLAHLAAGENLFAHPLIRPMLTLQPIFPVPREKGQGMLTAGTIENILDQGNPVWVAQGSGRSKTGSFHTHPGLLVNLAAACGVSVDQYVKDTNIVPIAVSAEYEPTACIVARILATGKKSRSDDLVAVTLGIWGYKGAAHVAFTPRLKGEFPKAVDAAMAIDRAILTHYKCYDTNRYAYAERSRYPVAAWKTATVATELLVDKRLIRQVRSAPPEIQPYIVSRYAMPEHNRKLMAMESERIPDSSAQRE